MLLDCFKLNNAESADTVDSPDDLKALLRSKGELDNLIYTPDTLSLPRPFNRITKKNFRNVSFNGTHFYDVEFTACTFEDCLFVGCTFERCEIHHCTFAGSNLHKARFMDTYVDPQMFVGIYDTRDQANIGLWVFQQLRSNSLSTHQPDFFQTADSEFQRWKRFQMHAEVRLEKKLPKEIRWPVFWNWAYELLLGYGHSLKRFALTTICGFSILVAFNCVLFWSYLPFHMGTEVKETFPLIRITYFTIVTLTTLGFGDITPLSKGGMVVAAGEALLGVIWFGMLTSIIVKKVFR